MNLGQRLAIRYLRTKFRLLSAVSKQRAAEKAFALFCTPQQRNRKKLPPVFEKAEKLELSFAGETVRGYRWNHPCQKKLLILHGWESSVINFERYVKPLVEKGYEVLAFDALAHGRSGGRSVNVLQYRQQIATIFQHYGPVKSFLAHSLGGLTATLFLESIPHDDSYRLALIAPATETVRAADNFFRFLQLDDEVRAAFDGVIEKLGGHPPAWFSVARAAPNLAARVLFLQDKDDELTPYADVKPIENAGYPNFRFVITEGLGHRRIYRDNQVAKTIIDFF